MEKLQTDLRGYLSDLRQDREHRFKGRTLASLIGRILALRYALAPARVATRELLACLRQLPLRQTAVGHATRDYDATVRLSDGAVAELLFWQDVGPAWSGLRWTATTPDVVLYTDACPGGWGALAVAVENGIEGEVVDWEQGELAREQVPDCTSRSVNWEDWKIISDSEVYTPPT